MDLNLKDKVAIVTGGSRGLGRTICLALAAEGVQVGINCYRNASQGVDLSAEALALADEIRATCHTDARVLPGDVSNEADVKEMFRQAAGKFGRVDILVNNAGICPVSFVKDMPTSMWLDTIRINLTGTFLTSREMVNHLLVGHRPGRIVNIVSQAAFNGSATGKSHYAASKAGIVAFTVSLAKETASQGIAVNAVAPGMMRTEMVAETLKVNEEKYNKSIPLGRIGETREIADVVVFLASEKASYMTGVTVDVSGGMLMR